MQLTRFVSKERGTLQSSFHRWLENGPNNFPSDFNDVVYESFPIHKELWRQTPSNKQNIFIWGAFELEKEGDI